MRKRVLCAALAALCVLSLAGCAPKADGLKAAFITDGSPLEDGGINQIVWQTLESLANGVALSVEYAVPKDAEKDTLLAEIDKLCGKGVNLIVLHGYVFADVVQEAQILQKNCRFIALDFAPSTLGDSVVSVNYRAHEAGFLAGFAAALRLEQGRFGAVLGLEIPAFQQYSYGFQQGVLYANAHYDTQVSMEARDFAYVGSVANDSQAQQLAAALYDSGVDCLLIAAGQAGLGALTEAKLRRANGADIWAVGSEYTYFSLGTYDGNNSVIITSAIKRWREAVIDMFDLAMQDKFPGGQVVIYDSANGGVGIPSGEYNLTVEMRQLCLETAALIAKGEITVHADWQEGLIR